MADNSKDDILTVEGKKALEERFVIWKMWQGLKTSKI